ncbi:MAG: hypothetical protein IPN34_27655 [Planctomycetes bacterium]|nr:hypothetical protein [Planctomycetota bacterium]
MHAHRAPSLPRVPFAHVVPAALLALTWLAPAAAGAQAPIVLSFEGLARRPGAERCR